ncbi:MAG TPA: hypothetical protein VFB27_01090 [Opitutaceae bacterium]|nr:hypothetical protein [Opitutaceae bacterium]
MKFYFFAFAAVSLLGFACTDRLAAEPPEEPTYGVAPVRDDYIYYPAYEVYYSNVRHQYVYRAGGQWVTRTELPPHIPLEKLHASPSVHMKYHDHPWLHHTEVIHDYPRDWTPQTLAPSPGRDKEDRRNDLRDERHDAVPIQPGPPR